MMTKSLFHWMLMAAVVCGLSLSVSSCKDDDDPSEEQQRQEQQKVDEREAAWMVLSQLIDPTTAGDDWTTQTFEPTIGEEDESSPLQRVVKTNTLQNAAQRFANIVGLETLDSTTATYTYSNPQLGTLTYHRSNDGVSLATVDVDIRQLPRLKQIVYRNPKQSDENGLFSSEFPGRAYYRFGDVVRLKNKDAKYEYWVCVRPSLGYEGKGDSHWVTLSPLPEDHIKVKTVGNKTFRVPTALGTDKENTANFAEMLCMLLDYDGWNNYYADHQGEKTFHDLDLKDHLNYNGEFYWDIVKEAWKEKNLARDVFGPGINSNDELLALLKGDGIRLLYNGFSWSWIGDKCTLYQATLKGPGQGQQLSNLLKPEYTTFERDMRQCPDFDGQRLEQQDVDNFFTDGKQRWCIRHATGKQLGGGRYDVKKSLTTTNPDVEDYYVYYRYAEARGNEIFDLSLDPERTTLTDRDLPTGVHTNVRGYFMFGDMVTDQDGCRWICVQGSQPEKGHRYSYFISFDKCVTEKGKADFSQLPTLGLAKQILFDLLDQRYFYYPVVNNNYPSCNPFKNLDDDCGFNYGKYLVGRETIVNNENATSEVTRRVPLAHYIFNMLYRGDDGKPYILRLAEEFDTRVKLFEEGNIKWHYYTCYPKDIETAARPMSVEDLSNQAIVNQYANADFVHWTWLYYDYDRQYKDSVDAHYQNANKLDEVYKNANEAVQLAQTMLTGYYACHQGLGPRTQAIAKDDKQWIFDHKKDLRYGNLQGTNMYREPVIMVAVKRCVDNGSKPYHFDDAARTPLYHWISNSSDKFDNKYYKSTLTVVIYNRYKGYSHANEFWVDNQQVTVPFGMEMPTD